MHEEGLRGVVRNSVLSAVCDTSIMVCIMYYYVLVLLWWVNMRHYIRK